MRHHLLCLLICVWVGCGELKKYTKKRGSPNTVSKHFLEKFQEGDVINYIGV